MKVAGWYFPDREDSESNRTRNRRARAHPMPDVYYLSGKTIAWLSTAKYQVQMKMYNIEHQSPTGYGYTEHGPGGQRLQLGAAIKGLLEFAGVGAQIGGRLAIAGGR
eukprot:4632300-Pleurochrysis_carterae.AAC.1